MSAQIAAFSFDAFVTSIVFDRGGAPAFALGDGTVQLATLGGLAVVEAHQGAVLCAAPHPSGSGIVTGGDDGAVVWSRMEGNELAAMRLAERRGRWIDGLASARATGLMAFAAGREVSLIDATDLSFTRSFQHERTVGGLAFDPKGRRLATASYGGVSLWWAKIADQKPQVLKWPGGHGAIVWSPDGRFIVSSLQENQLHGWRVADAKDMRMGGYPAKVKSMAFADNGSVLVTSGADGAVVWPFVGPNGPMGREAAEIGASAAGAKTSCVAAAAGRPVVAAGFDDGSLWVANLKTGKIEKLKADAAAPVSALAVSDDGSQLAWGDEAGSAGLLRLVGL